MNTKQSKVKDGVKAVEAILQELAAMRWDAALLKQFKTEMIGGKKFYTYQETDGVPEYVSQMGRPYFAFDVRHIFCAVANHPAVKDAKDKDLLRLQPLFLNSPMGRSHLLSDSELREYERRTAHWHNEDELDSIDGFDEQVEGKSGVIRNLRKVVAECLRVVNEMGTARVVAIQMQAKASLVLVDGEYNVIYSCDAADGYEWQGFFWRLWNTAAAYPREVVARCRKCERFFVTSTAKAMYCSRACTEASKRQRYAQGGDRAEDQSLSMMLTNYRRRYNGRNPSKDFAAQWLTTYRQKRQAKGKPTSTRPVETVLAKL
jgi:hypothetical protein